MPALRTSLRDLVHRDDGPRADEPRAVTNAGLVLDRYLAESVGKGENRALQALYRAMAGAKPPEVYPGAYRRWQRALADLAGPAERPCSVTHEFAVNGRMIVGLGAESVRETGITLHRLYGVPLIPGSALKGLAHHYALAAQRQQPAGDRSAFESDLAVLFGAPPGRGTRRREELGHDEPEREQGMAGHLTFFDAWYIPGSAPDDRPLAQDVITVHHPRYYAGKGAGNHAPWDFDDPNPTPFLSARGAYLIAVLGPTRAWAQLGLDLLKHALAEWGIGGKTSSGYGRAEGAPTGAPAPAAPGGRASQAGRPMPQNPQVAPMISWIQGIRPRDLKGQSKAVYDLARQRLSPADRLPVLRALRERLEREHLLAGWGLGSAWVQQLLAELDEDDARHGRRAPG